MKSMYGVFVVQFHVVFQSNLFYMHWYSALNSMQASILFQKKSTCTLCTIEIPMIGVGRELNKCSLYLCFID